MGESIKIEGLDKITATLDKLCDTSKLEKAMNNACLIVERDARSLCPKNTGKLRESIESNIVVESWEIKGVVGTPLEYAPYINYGTGIFAVKGGRKTPWCYQDDNGQWHTTSGQKPQPFLTNAFEQNKQAIIEQIKEGLKND